jgi:hypothetical protein
MGACNACLSVAVVLQFTMCIDKIMYKYTLKCIVSKNVSIIGFYCTGKIHVQDPCIFDKGKKHLVANIIFTMQKQLQ